MTQKFYEGLVNPAAMQNNGALNADGDREYYVQPVQINRSQYIEANCNAIMFFNIGTVNAVLNGITLAPGIGFSIPANLGEKDVTKWQVQFPTNVGANLLVVRKQYVK